VEEFGITRPLFQQPAGRLMARNDIAHIAAAAAKRAGLEASTHMAYGTRWRQ